MDGADDLEVVGQRSGARVAVGFHAGGVPDDHGMGVGAGVRDA